MPFKDECFDVVVCFNVLDHMSNPNRALLEIKRVLKKDGIFLFYLNTFMFPKLLKGVLSYVDKPHPYHFQHKEIFSILKETGFTIEFQHITRSDISKVKHVLSFVFLGLQVVFIKCVKDLRR